MQTNMVRQPILNRSKEVVGYEILYQDDSSSIYNQMDTQAANVIEDFLLQLDSEKFLDGKIAYLTFTPNLLLKNIPKMFESSKLVIQIEDSSIIHPLAQRVIYRYKKQGYRVALKGFEFAPRFFQLMDVVDIIKIDFTKYHETSLDNVVAVAKSFGKDLVAYHVDSQEAYKRAWDLGIKDMQGSAVAQALSSNVHRMDHMQSNFFHLVVAITKDEPDIDEIAQIVSRDVTLAFSLIKMVNSAYFALKNRATSVKQALIILGLGQLKQWVYLLSFKNDDSTMPSELIRISFLRANFCAELCQCAQDMPIAKSEAYLMGMFSTLGTLMEVPLEKALSELPVSEDIKVALLSGSGRCGILYKLVLSYENADWNGVSGYAQQLSVPTNIISQKYFECVEYVNNIWHELTEAYSEEGGEDDERDTQDATL
ncbi:MAG: HDOD domain-containing protein [Angelakisella sp.]